MTGFREFHLDATVKLPSQDDPQGSACILGEIDKSYSLLRVSAMEIKFIDLIFLSKATFMVVFFYISKLKTIHIFLFY